MPPKVIRRHTQEAIRLSAAAGAATIKAAEGEGEGAKLGTFDGIAYTGAVMEPGGWYGRIVCDLDGIRVPQQKRPALRQHDHNQVVGHTESVTVTNPGGVAVAGVFSGEKQHTDKVLVPGRNGFPWQLSIGATPVRTEFLEAGEEATVNGLTVVGPLTISRETELGEVSFVPLGADGDTSVSVSASTGGIAVFAKTQLKLARKQGYKAAARYSDGDIEKMSEDEAKAALKECTDEPEPKAKAKAKAEDDDPKKTEADDDADGDDEPKKTEAGKGRGGFKAAIQKEIEAARKAAADEHRRVSEITARVQKYAGVNKVKLDDGRTVDLIPHAIECGMTANEAERYALLASRPGPGVGVPGGLAYSTTTPEVSEAVLEAAVLQASRHQLLLNRPEFYHEATPDGKGMVRRVPHHIEAAFDRDWKARYPDQVEQTAHTLFKGRVGFKQLLATAGEASGINRRHIDLNGEEGVRTFFEAWHHNSGVRAGGFQADGAANLSISNILSNVMNKFALQGYLFGEQAWREIAGVKPVNDFKPVKSVNMLGDVMFKKIGPTGEIESFSLSDQAFANQADPYARMGTIPWTHVVNDDLGILGSVPQKLGQGFITAVNDVVWTLFKNMAAGSVNGDDGNAFWRTGSSVTAAAIKAGLAYKANKMSGGTTALSAASLQTAKALFDNQIDPNGNPLGFDGMKPTLLFGPSNWQTAMALLQASGIVYGGGSAALQPNANVFNGFFTPVMSRYIENANYVNSATAWWMLFNPVALAVIELVFLHGIDTPTIVQAGPDYQFDRLGISMRGTGAFGASQQNFRGGVYSVGA